MTNLEVRTKLGQEEVVERLKKYFGKGGLGLEICRETPQCLSFEGGGGYVTTTICPEEEENYDQSGNPGMGLSGEGICIWSSLNKKM